MLVAQLVKDPPAMRETWVQSLGWEDPLERGKATHSSILAWRIPWLYSPWDHKESDTTEWLSLHMEKKKIADVKILGENSPELSLCAPCNKCSWRKEAGESDKYMRTEAEVSERERHVERNSWRCYPAWLKYLRMGYKPRESGSFWKLKKKQIFPWSLQKECSHIATLISRLVIFRTVK